MLKLFYDGQRNGDLTQTSHASPQQYIDAFLPILENGRDILYLSLSGGLTGFECSVALAREQLAKQYPDAVICSVDSLSAAGGIGLLAELAEENRTNGMSIQENAAALEQMRHHISHLFMAEDLMYLKRGDRISAATAVVGTALGVRPILSINEQGKLAVIDKIRGQKHALQELLTRWQNTRDPIQNRIVIAHTDAPECAEALACAVRKYNPQADITCTMLNPIIGAHTGPGMAALIYFGDRTAICT